jgi:anti-sigma B factor antagonist
MRADSFPVELVRGVPVVTAPEEIDITNAAGLRAGLLEAAGQLAFVVDMTRTRFCDSAGISALIEAHKRARAAGGQLLLAMSGVAVPRIFELTGVDRVIPSFTSLEEALAHTPAGTGPLPLPLPDLAGRAFAGRAFAGRAFAGRAFGGRA